jgi:hypothetical protein
MTTPDLANRTFIRLDAGRSLEVGQWLVANADILPTTPRPALAKMASEALGYPVSPSTIALQGEIRGFQTGRPHKKHGPKPEAGHDKRIARLEKDVYNLAKALSTLYTDPASDIVLYGMLTRMEAAK